jgi:hypothetical protein
VPQTPQEVSLLFNGNRADERILLTLNNNHASDLLLAVTVYTASGQEETPPDFHLVGSESRVVELDPLLQTAGLGHQQIGWLKLSYTGVYLGLGAQLTLYSSPFGMGTDSPRSLSKDFTSGMRHAAFWMPEGGEAQIAFTNSSSINITVQLRCGYVSEDFVIPCHNTKVKV